MTKDSSRNEQSGWLYAITPDGKIRECLITRRTAKRVYFTTSMLGQQENHISRADLDRDGQVTHGYPGWTEKIGPVLYVERPAISETVVTPAAIVAIPSAPSDDSTRNDDDDGDLWTALARGDWSSSATAYATATVADHIIKGTPMTVAAFAAECKRRNITGWQSQGSVSRRLRWAALHDQCWQSGILPKDVFLSEAATRPLFDGKLTDAQRLQLLAELFGPHMIDEQKRDLAIRLSEALMREHLAKQAGDSSPEYKSPRMLVPEKVIAKLLAQGTTAEKIAEIAHHLKDSARQGAAG